MNLISLDFCETLESLLQAGEVTGETGKKFKELHAASTINNIRTIRKTFMQLQPSRTLEIGLAYGASCLTFAACHKEVGHPPTGQHFAIDPFQSTVWDNVARKLLKESELEAYVTIQETYSHFSLPQILLEKQKFDLIYVDGSHLFEDVFLDMYYSIRLLENNGIILFDDSSDKHVRKVIDFIDSNLKSSLSKIDLSSNYIGLNKYKYKLACFLKKNQLTAYQKIGKCVRNWDAIFNNF